MKKFTSFILLSIITLFAFTAQCEVTKFLGIPVDGPKSEMINKLKAKGFTLENVNGIEYMTGRFNGVDVNVHIVTENDKVCRIMLSDVNSLNAADIIIRFNKLCSQFKDNGKYLTFEDYTIPSDERISLEMTIHNKRYEALFYQMPSQEEAQEMQNYLLENVQTKYSPEELEEPTEAIKAEIIDLTFDILKKTVINRPVWFMINENRGKYYITMYYDNELNRANGEDL